eukprot:1942490-Alexandrium_andersonii.AAC.1
MCPEKGTREPASPQSALCNLQSDAVEAFPKIKHGSCEGDAADGKLLDRQSGAHRSIRSASPPSTR